jgi:BirA family biotin operon repressor/biotin-[acetyl-CoA-carboxylase] ligase
MTSPLSQQLVDSLFADLTFVPRARYLTSTSSTNDALKRMAAEGAPEGTLVVADEQTAGRGRLERKWVAPPGTSILLSILFRPGTEMQVSPLQYTIVCSLAVRDAVRERLALELGLKWPNDLVYQDRKLGGILTEIETGYSGVAYVIVGIGINANWDPSGAEFDQPATSLCNLVGKPVSRAELLRAIVGRIAERYAALRADESPVKEWEIALDTIGKAVVVESPGERLEGFAVGVDADGALMVRSADGSLHRVMAGDVRVRRMPFVKSSG